MIVTEEAESPIIPPAKDPEMWPMFMRLFLNLPEPAPTNP